MCDLDLEVAHHPHIREDYGQEMGLYGNIIVDPADRDYWAPVNREWVLTLDDVLIEDGRIAPFSRSETSYAAMGRFGNVLLVAGEPELALEARHGEVVRLYLTNTANTRVFKVKLPGARMKVVGGDSGRCEREEIVEEAILAPSERVILDVLFERPGELALEHHTPEKVYRLASIALSDEPAEPSLTEAFEQLRIDPELSAEREGLDRHLSAEPDKTLAFVAEMDFDEPAGGCGLHVPHAPRGRLGGAGPLPELRHEAHGDDAHVHVPHASRGGLRSAGPVPELRHEAAARPRRSGGRSPRARAWPRPRKRPRR
jgi:FtsP/CotA-like multicopper oxidase with cupredoxin domain